MATTQRLGERLIGLAVILQLIPICGALVIVETRHGGERATLLVPLSAAARRALPARVLDGRNLLLGGGLLPGSLVVRFADASAPPLWRDGVIAIRVPARLCGA